MGTGGGSGLSLRLVQELEGHDDRYTLCYSLALRTLLCMRWRLNKKRPLHTRGVGREEPGCLCIRDCEVGMGVTGVIIIFCDSHFPTHSTRMRSGTYSLIVLEDRYDPLFPSWTFRG